MELMVQLPNLHHFPTPDGPSPNPSLPSSPTRCANPFDLYNHYTSAPASPRRAAAIYKQFNDHNTSVYAPQPSTCPSTKSAVPFDWELSPGTPKARARTDDSDFSFDHSGQLDQNGAPFGLTSADELFEAGKIRPLKLPPRLQTSCSAAANNSPRPKASTRSPRRRGTSELGPIGPVDPFVAAMVETTRDRGRSSALCYPNSTSRKGSRSLSPRASAEPAGPIAGLPKACGGGSRKWRLRDLLLFRSASEGRKDTIRKYSLVGNRKVGDDGQLEARSSSSFRSVESCCSCSSVRRTEGNYKRKTALAYRQGVFSCLGFNPAINGIVRGFSRKT